MKLSYRVRLTTVALGATAAVGFGAVVPMSGAAAQVAPDVTLRASGPACARSALDVPAWGSSVSLTSADPSGHFQVGTARDADDNVHLLRWSDGSVADLATHGLAFGPSDVNASGEIAGGDYDEATGRYVGWRYRDGSFSALPGQAPYVDVRPSAINAAGQVAGRVDDPAASRLMPARWDADNSVTVLGLPADRNTATVQDIDDDGTVLGTIWYDDGNTGISKRSAIVWYADGTWRLLSGLQPDTETSGASIRAGQVVGGQADGTILVWNAATGEASPLNDGVTGNATAINAGGSIVGSLSGFGAAFMAEGAEPRALPVTDPVMGSGAATALTDDDVAYGNDTTEDGTPTPVRWDCGE